MVDPPEVTYTVATSTKISSDLDAVQIPKWFPRWRGKPWYNGNPEALGWLIDGIGRAIVFIGSGAFFSAALLRLANESLGCELGEECDGRILGVRPSSILTTYTLFVGITSSVSLPVVGAVVDYTNHRQLFGRVTSGLFIISIFPIIFLNENNFIAMTFVQFGSAILGWVQTQLTYAYLPELTDDEDLLNDYTKSYTMSFFASCIIYLMAIIGGVSLTGKFDDDIYTSRVSMIVAFSLNVTLLPIAWGFLMKKRNKMHELPEGKSLITAGFTQVYRTGKRIISERRALKWCFLAFSMSESGIQSLATIAVTHMTNVLKLSAAENGIAIFMTLLGHIPGAVISSYATRKLDPVRSCILGLSWMIVCVTLFAVFLVHPNQEKETYIILFFLGIGVGWKWTCDRVLVSSIMPLDQNTELMGFYLFSGQCLAWIPPLVYTAINEAGLSKRVGFLSLDIYFVISLIFYLFMGSYIEARQEVGRESRYTNNSNGNGTNNIEMNSSNEDESEKITNREDDVEINNT